jgi:hypothetical protein
MRRVALLLTVLSLLGIGIAPAANAYSVSGTAYNGDSGQPVPSQYVQIYNYCTSSWGSTYANGSGQFSFSSLTAGCNYLVTGDHCWVHSYYAGTTYWLQPASAAVENLYLNSKGTSC